MKLLPVFGKDGWLARWRKHSVAWKKERLHEGFVCDQQKKLLERCAAEVDEILRSGSPEARKMLRSQLARFHSDYLLEQDGHYGFPSAAICRSTDRSIRVLDRLVSRLDAKIWEDDFAAASVPA